MRASSLLRTTWFAAAVVGIAATAGAQSKVVVSHDEWFTSPGNLNTGEKQFVSNITNWFGLGGTGNVLLYSGDGYLVNTGFTTYLQSLGYTVTANASASSFSGYGAVFVEGNPTYDAVGLGNYVRGGGNVVYIGGTGIDGPAAEATYSNLFLNQFGLGFVPVYNGISGNVNTTGFSSQSPFGSSLFTGVTSVYANSGNDVLSTVSAPADVTREVFYTSDYAGARQGVFGAAEVTTTPEPASIALLGTGLFGLVPMIRRRNRNS
ncbi:MAG: PEP-CTERM sorting domain-containing protein [Gemmatimonadaceae bacterium]